MRLRDLDASFRARYRIEEGRHTHGQVDTLEGAQGACFQCPKCAQGKDAGEEDGRRFVIGAHYILVWLRVPRGADPVPPDAVPGPARWGIGEKSTGLDDLTLTPSIVLPGPGCAWHRFVRDGEAVPA